MTEIGDQLVVNAVGVVLQIRVIRFFRGYLDYNDLGANLQSYLDKFNHIFDK